MNIGEKTKRKIFNWIIDNETKDAQKKFGFQINTGKNPTWNNEADAFKHAFLSWYLSYYHGDDEAKRLGDMHEDETPNAPWYERNMDLWNNQIGREVAYEMKEGLGDDYDLLGNNWAKERAKRIIWEKMKKVNLLQILLLIGENLKIWNWICSKIQTESIPIWILKNLMPRPKNFV